MDDSKSPIDMARDADAEFARKMDSVEYGPTTTIRELLLAAGVELPAPDGLDDPEVRRTLWRVIAALAQLRVFLDLTDHLTDRQLYTALWTEHLQFEVPAVDEIGFNTHLEHGVVRR
jgi:hypothetical protein